MSGVGCIRRRRSACRGGRERCTLRGAGQPGVGIRVDFHPVQQYRLTVLTEVQQVRSCAPELRRHRGGDVRAVDRLRRAPVPDSSRVVNRICGVKLATHAPARSAFKNLRFGEPYQGVGVEVARWYAHPPAPPPRCRTAAPEITALHHLIDLRCAGSWRALRVEQPLHPDTGRRSELDEPQKGTSTLPGQHLFTTHGIEVVFELPDLPIHGRHPVPLHNLQHPGQRVGDVLFRALDRLRGTRECPDGVGADVPEGACFRQAPAPSRPARLIAAMPRRLLPVGDDPTASRSTARAHLYLAGPIGLREGLNELPVPRLLGLADQPIATSGPCSNGTLTIPGCETQAGLVEDGGDGSSSRRNSNSANTANCSRTTPVFPLIPEPPSRIHSTLGFREALTKGGGFGVFWERKFERTGNSGARL